MEKDHLSGNEHVYIQVADIIRNEISFGQLIERIPSAREISKTFGVNFKTANKAISKLVDEGLAYRLRGVGTFVVQPQPSTAPETSKLVGLILSDVINPNFALLAEAIQRHAYESNIAVVVNTTSGNPESLQQTLDLYQSSSVEAVIVQGGAIRRPECKEILARYSIPVIGDHTHLDDYDDVWIDVRAGAQMAVSHLIESVGGPVAYVSGSDEAATSTGRYKGYRDALLSHNVRLDDRLVQTTPPTYVGGHKAALAFVDKHPRPRALFCYNLVMAIGAVGALSSVDVAIPTDMAIAGCDDSVPVHNMIVPVTTVAFSYEEEARELLMLVNRRIESPKANALSIRIAPRLIVRASTQTPA